jgi:hypothetical protein
VEQAGSQDRNQDDGDKLQFFHELIRGRARDAPFLNLSMALREAQSTFRLTRMINLLLEKQRILTRSTPRERRQLP